MRHWRGEAAVLADFKSVTAVMEHANQQEQRAGGNAVRQHLEYSALHGNIMEREDAENNETKVADGRIRRPTSSNWAAPSPLARHK